MANNATGKVKRIYPYNDGCYVKLEYTGDKPKDGYFHLEKSHGNYNSLYSLAVVAAVNGYKLKIRASGNIVSSQHAQVVYMMINW